MYTSRSFFANIFFLFFLNIPECFQDNVGSFCTCIMLFCHWDINECKQTIEIMHLRFFKNNFDFVSVSKWHTASIFIFVMMIKAEAAKFKLTWVHRLQLRNKRNQEPKLISHAGSGIFSFKIHHFEPNCYHLCKHRHDSFICFQFS